MQWKNRAPQICQKVGNIHRKKFFVCCCYCATHSVLETCLKLKQKNMSLIYSILKGWFFMAVKTCATLSLSPSLLSLSDTRTGERSEETIKCLKTKTFLKTLHKFCWGESVQKRGRATRHHGLPSFQGYKKTSFPKKVDFYQNLT